MATAPSVGYYYIWDSTIHEANPDNIDLDGHEGTDYIAIKFPGGYQYRADQNTMVSRYFGGGGRVRHDGKVDEKINFEGTVASETEADLIEKFFNIHKESGANVCYFGFRRSSTVWKKWYNDSQTQREFAKGILESIQVISDGRSKTYYVVGEFIIVWT